MTVPSYTTDLITIALGSISLDIGTWDESSDAGWDTAGAMVDDANLYYNGSACVSAQYTKDGNGSGTTGPGTIMYNHGSTFTIPADGAVLVHHLWAAPPALNSVALGGIIILAGNNFGDFNGWNISGSDELPAPKGGWWNYAVNPVIGSPDHTVGAGGASPYSMVGIAVAATAQARGNPNACNAVRYGRCESIFTNGEAANYATFSGYGAVDSLIANKWSLVDPVEGGFKIQGLVSLGTTSTAVDFRDTNVNISIANTTKVTPAFNRFEVKNAASNIEWTAVNITALGDVSKGQFEVIDNAVVIKNSCVFTDMDFFKYQSNSIINTSVYRRCGLITPGGAPFTETIIDKCPGSISLTTDDLGILFKNKFTSSGLNHAVELTSLGGGSMIWDNLDPDDSYDAGVTGSPVTPTNTGNEHLFVNVAAGDLQINVAAGSVVPSIRSAGASVSVVADQVVLTINNTVTGGILIIYDDDSLDPQELGTELQRVDVSTASEDYIYSADKAGDDVVIVFIKSGYKLYQETVTLGSNSTIFNLKPEQETN